MASDDTKTVLSETDANAIRLMLSKLGEHHVVEIFQAVEGREAIGDLVAEALDARNIDF